MHSIQVPLQSQSLQAGQQPNCHAQGLGSTFRSVTLKKNSANRVGVSVGGGAPHCPCLYVVRVDEDSPAASCGGVACGDEIVSVNGQSVRGVARSEAVNLIRGIESEVTIGLNCFHVEDKDENMDALKQAKQRAVESMSFKMANTLGLSRAVIENDAVVERLLQLEQSAAHTWKGLRDRTRVFADCQRRLGAAQDAFGRVLADIGVRDTQPQAADAFARFGRTHGQMGASALECRSQLLPLLRETDLFLLNAVSDARQAVRMYLRCKFEHLACCLEVKEMEDEELSRPDILRRRLTLRCRQLSMAALSRARADALVKLELLDSEQERSTILHLRKLLRALLGWQADCSSAMARCSVFPVERSLCSLGHAVADDKDADL